MAQIKILCLLTKEDEPFLYYLREAIGTRTPTICTFRQFDFLSEVAATYKSKGITHVVTTQKQMIPLLCDTASSKEQTIDNYAGSWLEDTKYGISYLIINPLKQARTIAYGQFLLSRYISKITEPDNWVNVPEFSWSILETPAQYSNALAAIESSPLVAVDIETRPDLSMSCVSYTTLTHSYVMPLPYGLAPEEYEYRYQWIAKANATYTPKVLQNGKYDIAYLMRYGAPLANYLYDTAICHHAWYSELPKDLGILAAFYVRRAIFWKHEGDTGNAYDLYRYNAMDTYYTLWVFIAWISEAPAWARRNYLIEFPVLYPNILAETTGLAIDQKEFTRIKTQQTQAADMAKLELQQSIGVPNFNPSSPTQNKQLLAILGCSDLKSSDEKAMKRAAFRHPFNHWLIEKLLEYKKAAKLVSTYLNEDKFFNGRLLYSITPTTDTGRNKSKSHHFWTGFNIQNIPRSGGIKGYIIADEGFLIGEADYSQAESRDTGYITGDMTLISNVESERDFHKSNASMFFGVPYEEVSKELRQIGKPVNHGANYMMSDETLIDSMGLDNIYKAAKLLDLPRMWSAKQISKHLLSLFHKTYPVVSHDYPEYIKHTVKTIQRLTNAYGWVRYCFGNPSKDKAALRAYVAHLPQGLNAQALNKAFRLVYLRVWMPHHENFKLCAQVHDSILFQYRIGHEHLAELVKECMIEASTIDVTDINGTTRTLKVPVDISLGGKSWQDSKD